MPTPMVVATLPFPTAAATAAKPRFAYRDDAPATLTLPQRSPQSAPLTDAYESLLDEACDLARSLGCEVRRRLLGGAGGGGYRWVHGRLRIVLDVEASTADRLGVVADALRGEPRLPSYEMSPALAAFLQPRRAA